MKEFLQSLSSGRTLVCDGGWGSQLIAQGMPVGTCPEEWNFSHPEKVAAIARNYIASGAQVIKTNTFGANRYRLMHFGMEENAAEFALQGARISRDAAGEDVFVAGSVGPTGKLIGIDDVSEEEIEHSFLEQIQGLINGGVDVLLIETFYADDELTLALQAARKISQIPIICSGTYNKTEDGDFVSMTGVTPEKFLETALHGGADVIGANCGFGIADTLRIVQVYRDFAPNALLCAMPNAGLPEIVDGAIQYPESPALFASFAEQIQALQLSLIGGCCGTTPEHIAALKLVVSR